MFYDGIKVALWKHNIVVEVSIYFPLQKLEMFQLNEMLSSAKNSFAYYPLFPANKIEN